LGARDDEVSEIHLGVRTFNRILKPIIISIQQCIINPMKVKNYDNILLLDLGFVNYSKLRSWVQEMMKVQKSILMLELSKEY
jgi:hypothetical protein